VLLRITFSYKYIQQWLWGRPDSNQRPPAPEAGILPS
jgi:hypothetical protein